MPAALPGVDSGILDPRETYADPLEWEAKARKLVELFISNFHQYEDTPEGRAQALAGPSLTA